MLIKFMYLVKVNFGRDEHLALVQNCQLTNADYYFFFFFLISLAARLSC